MPGNVLVNQLEQNWRNYSPGIKVQRPLGGKIRKMGAKRIGVVPNLLNTNRKMTFANSLTNLANFAPNANMPIPQDNMVASPPLHPFQYMSYEDLQRLSPEQFSTLQSQYEDMMNPPLATTRAKRNEINLINVDPETRRKIQEQRKQRELGLASIREARGWVNTSTGVLREARSSAKALGLDKELQRSVRSGLGLGNE
jgi:hypothetical protein